MILSHSLLIFIQLSSFPCYNCLVQKSFTSITVHLTHYNIIVVIFIFADYVLVLKTYCINFPPFI